MSEFLMIEVAYATPAQQKLISLTVPTGTRVEAAVMASGMPKVFPEIDLGLNRVGIFGKLCKLDTLLRDHDRIEIYRPLIADPKDVRRQRLATGKSMGKQDNKKPA